LIVIDINVEEPAFPEYPYPYDVDKDQVRNLPAGEEIVGAGNFGALIRLKRFNRIFYDSSKIFSITSKETFPEDDYLTIPPKGTVGIACRVHRDFFAVRVLKTPPQRVTVRAKLADGHIVSTITELTQVSSGEAVIWKYRLEEPEEELPF
jgi:hypothetical protein